MEEELTAGQILMNNANKVVPTPKSDAKQITGLVKDSGRITGYQLSDGRLVTKDEGVLMAKQGEIAGVAVATKKGTEYLRGLPDGSEGNNLGSLPTVNSKYE